jgi:hypothetical protein
MSKVRSKHFYPDEYKFRYEVRIYFRDSVVPKIFPLLFHGYILALDLISSFNVEASPVSKKYMDFQLGRIHFEY